MNNQINVKSLLKYLGIGLGAFAVIGLATFGIVKLIGANSKDDGPTASGGSIDPTTGAHVEIGGRIDLQLPVNQWVDSQQNPNNSSIVIYDLDHSAIVARHNEDAVFDMAQLYQLFVAYEGYYRIARNTWAGDFPYENLNLDRATCLDYMLRWSYVECSDTMWDEIGRDNLQELFKAKNYSQTKIGEFTSTASEINSLMHLYWNHPNFSNEIWQTIRTSLLDQLGNTTFDGQNLRQGLPSGFNTAKVYNKSGWYKTDRENTNSTEDQQNTTLEPIWHTYDDTAFVEFPETKNRNGNTVPARHYIITVMTRDTSPRQIVTLARSIELAVKTADNY